jgi:hypothetical protein
MKHILSLFILTSLADALSAQYVYTIKADSVKITNCDSSELIIENHTQGVPGFLYNTGNGRTVFKRGVVKINDSFYLVGADTLNIHSQNFWSLSGNSGIDTSRQFIGTNDNNPMIFHTSGYERMRLFADGNLGINTGSADNGFKLQVNGNVFASGTQHLIGNLGIAKGNDVAYIGTAIGIRSDDSYSSFILEGSNQGWATDMFTFQTGYGNIGKEVYNTDGSIVKIKSGFVNANVGNLSANALYINPTYNLWTNSYPMTFRGIYYNPVLTNLGTGSRHIAIETVSGDILLGTTSGNTGIGTNSPTAQLHTTGSVRFAGLTSDTTKTRIVVSDANGNLYYRDASTLAVNGILNADLANGSAILPSLAVNGTISAQRLKLSQAGWPDYVFARNYHLPALEYLEQYIQQNGHLPGIPSAAEVEKKGVDVGDNQAALLKKIEELTLYAIGQNKKLEAQAEELNTLKQEMSELKRIMINRPAK